VNPSQRRIKRKLDALSPREYEGLHRFYVLQHNTPEILQALNMSESEFRELQVA
jgi:hypothetical protein